MTLPRRTIDRMAHGRSPWMIAMCALALGGALLLRAHHVIAGSPPTSTPTSTSTSTSRRSAPSNGPISYGAGTVTVPRGWGLVDRRNHVSTWSEPQRGDAVTVASVEASSAPLVAVVGDVAASSRRLPEAVDVSAPHELRVARGTAGDSALLVTMTLRDPHGRVLHVRQIWRRDTRAARDVVATWTSRDDHWPTTPEDGVPDVA